MTDEVSEIPSGSGSKETETVQQDETNADSKPQQRPRTRRGGLKKNRKKFILPYTEGQWNPVPGGRTESEPAYSQYILKNHPWWREEENSPEVMEKKPRKRSNKRKKKKSSKTGAPGALHVEKSKMLNVAKKFHIPSLYSLSMGNKVSQCNGRWPEPSHKFPENHDSPTIPKQIPQQIQELNNTASLHKVPPKSQGTKMTDQGNGSWAEGFTDETSLSFWPYRTKLQLKGKNPEPSAGPSWITAQDTSSARTSNVPSISHGYAGFDDSSAAQCTTSAPINAQMLAVPSWPAPQVVANSAMTSNMPATSNAYADFGNASVDVNVQTPGYDPNGMPAPYSGPQYPQLSTENYAQYYETYQQQMWIAQYGEQFNQGGT
ncbi:hypothetical protein DdX_09675 [Ditylenchus destructor]|uniref:Uncharacterized protein n=1 Tax=Ditylenchus destructor TaxID=166010 RepID=A0AAD4N5D1_9BILA|nr:hypothetical protein DdX_09675 [Ditylenchus destructor]